MHHSQVTTLSHSNMASHLNLTGNSLHYLPTKTGEGSRMRGEPAPAGTERRAKNGYWYVKTEDRGWVLKHWLVWEKTHGELIDSTTVIVRFVDGKKGNFDPANIKVVPKGKASDIRRLALLEAKIQDLQ